jgi:N-acetylglucosaminyl-diphospho-decaprenol L-rhamnosyltransferase
MINYRTAVMTLDSVRSLAPERLELPALSVVVVDNASGDDSVAQIGRAIVEHGWESWVRVVESPVNGGFAAGNNVGIRSADADAYLLLNSDTIVRPGAIAALVRAMLEHPRAGIISPRLEWPDGAPQASCFNFIRPVHAFLASARTRAIERMVRNPEVALPVCDDPTEPDWTSFACVLIRGQVIQQIGLMDEGYFMYYDDVDYCRRAQAAGWTVLNWPSAHVVHLRGGSGPVKRLTAERGRRPRYFYESRARYFAKFYGRGGLWRANALWTLGRGISWLRELLRTKPPHTCRHELRDNWINALDPMHTVRRESSG